MGQVKVQVAEALVGGRSALMAVRRCIALGEQLTEPALHVLYAACTASPALCEAGAVTNVPQVSSHREQPPKGHIWWRLKVMLLISQCQNLSC